MVLIESLYTILPYSLLTPSRKSSHGNPPKSPRPEAADIRRSFFAWVQESPRCNSIWGVSPKYFGGPYYKGYNTLGSILGSPYFGKFPFTQPFNSLPSNLGIFPGIPAPGTASEAPWNHQEPQFFHISPGSSVLCLASSWRHSTHSETG